LLVRRYGRWALGNWEKVNIRSTKTN
jgi:hypothetical protein